VNKTLIPIVTWGAHVPLIIRDGSGGQQFGVLKRRKAFVEANALFKKMNWR
jgi:hypothetical protein